MVAAATACGTVTAVLRVKRIALVSTCMFVLGVLGFTAAQSIGAPPTNPPIARDSHCTGKTTHAAVVSFVTAFNRGNYEDLDALFAEPPSFQWYSSARPGARIGPGSRNRSTLVTYFRRRHEAGDRLALITFDFNGDSGRYGNFGLTMRRSVSNFKHGDWFRLNAKGALICEADSTQFIVMTLAGPEKLSAPGP